MPMRKTTRLSRDANGHVSQNVNTERHDHGQVTLDNATPVELTVNSVRTKLLIWNYADAADSIFVGKSDVSFSGANRGLELVPGSGFEFNVTNEVKIYGVTASGSFDVFVQELY